MTRVLASLQTRAARVANNDRGATAVEYGLMVGLIAVVIVGAVTLLGQQLLNLFNLITAALPAVPAA
jgi:pilus assembly protein Flp/PilA